jgi:hypothetical protein
MNTIRSYKALAIVSNVDQGEMIKRLIKENKELRRFKKHTEKYIRRLVEICTFLNKCIPWGDRPPNGIDDGAGNYGDYFQCLKFTNTLDQFLTFNDVSGNA